MARATVNCRILPDEPPEGVELAHRFVKALTGGRPRGRAQGDDSFVDVALALPVEEQASFHAMSRADVLSRAST